MANPTTTKITQYFNKITLTPIISTPTHETIKNLQPDLNINTVSVPSDTTQFGHLILSINPANYLLKTAGSVYSP